VQRNGKIGGRDHAAKSGKKKALDRGSRKSHRDPEFLRTDILRGEGWVLCTWGRRRDSCKLTRIRRGTREVTGVSQ